MNARGEKHYRAKLTDDDVRLLRACDVERREHLRKAKELSSEKMAEKFNVSKRAIEAIYYGQAWNHVD